MIRALLSSMLILVALAHSARGQVTEEPVLRLDPGMHTALVSRIDIDASGRFLVTGSFDKTVRVWSLEDGALLRTLRVPLNEGNVGKIYAVAISPDGERVAASGWGPGSDGPHDIYIFERATGRLLDRVDGLPNVIFHLAFSPDGRHLVATLFGANGIRVFETEGFGQVAEDTDYGADSYWATFDASGRLATTSYDGKLRLYDPQFRLLRMVAAPGGERPVGIAFSPDGTRLAVGYVDTIRVDVLDGGTLEHRFEAETGGVDNGDLARVAWSADGRFLHAGGRYYDHETDALPFRRWADGGRGPYRDVALSQNTIINLRPLSGGRLAFGAFDPALGVLAADGTVLWRHDPAQADLRGQQEKLAVSEDGTSVAFGFEILGASPARFDLAARRLSLDPPADPALATARTRGLPVEDWKNKTDPTLDGKPLPLKTYETSRSLAIAPDGERFLLGTGWYLRLFDRAGEQIWEVPAPSPARAVNVTGDGRLALAAFGDGTIRWYRLDDGEELLAFFPHADRERWVAWTPEGYYMASPGGEELIGWHVNRGLDQAPEFYTAARFRERFHRPDVVALVLEELDVGRALARADRERAATAVAVAPAVPRADPERDLAAVKASLPPVVEIVGPVHGTRIFDDFAVVTYLLRTHSASPPRVSVHLNGRFVRSVELTSIEGEVADQVLVRLKGHLDGADAQIRLVAEDEHGASDPAEVALVWSGAPQPKPQPRLFVLAIGVSEYRRNPPRNLDFADDDAQNIAAKFLEQKGLGLYRDVIVDAVVDNDASLSGIIAGLNRLREQVEQGDVAIVFLAGHGKDLGGDYYYLPHNVDTRSGADLAATALGKIFLLNSLHAMYRKGAKVLAFLDTCYAGASGAGARDGPADINLLAQELSSAGTGIIVLTSSTADQVAKEDSAWKNGAFTEALLEALDGRARPGHGAVRISDLGRYVERRVKELTGGVQTPQLFYETKLAIDAPIAVVR